MSAGDGNTASGTPTADVVDRDTSSDTPPPLLNCKFFPHIMDLIVTYASWETLLAMRATSTYFKNRLERVFSDHIIVQHCEWNVGDGGRGVREAFVTKREYRRLPDMEEDDAYALGDIRVLDLNVPVDERLADAINNCFIDLLDATWVRTRGNTWFQFEPLHVSSKVHVHFLLDASSSRDIPYGIETSLPLGTGKVVINLEHDCVDLIVNPALQLRIAAWKKTRRLQSLVFLSKPDLATAETGTVTSCGHKRCLAVDHSHPKFQKNLTEFIGLIAANYWTAALCRVTLVGFPLKCIAPKLFVDDGVTALPPSKEDVLSHLKEGLCEMYSAANLDSNLISSTDIGTCIEQTEIIDHETYRRRVGEEAYRLETVW